MGRVLIFSDSKRESLELGLYDIRALNKIHQEYKKNKWGALALLIDSDTYGTLEVLQRLKNNYDALYFQDLVFQKSHHIRNSGINKFMINYEIDILPLSICSRILNFKGSKQDGITILEPKTAGRSVYRMLKLLGFKNVYLASKGHRISVGTISNSMDEEDSKTYKEETTEQINGVSLQECVLESTILINFSAPLSIQLIELMKEPRLVLSIPADEFTNSNFRMSDSCETDLFYPMLTQVAVKHNLKFLSMPQKLRLAFLFADKPGLTYVCANTAHRGQSRKNIRDAIESALKVN